MKTTEKKDVANQILRKSNLFVHLDPRIDGVIVPPQFNKQNQLTLEVGLAMTIPIPDLRIDDEGLFGTLSFLRSPFACFIPWKAIYALVGDDSRGMTWPESMPNSVKVESRRERFRVIQGGKSA